MITREELKIARNKLDALLKDFQPGMTTTIGKIKYDESSYSVTIDFKTKSSVSDAISHIAVQHTAMLGLGDITKPSSDGYSIVDYLPKRWKKPWLVLNSAGERRIAPDEFVRARWSRA